MLPATLLALVLPTATVLPTSAPPGPIGRAVAAAHPGDTVRVPAGVHREATIVIDRPLTLLGEPGAILDGEGERGLIVVRAPDVTITGLTLRHTGSSYTEDRAALLADEAVGCHITGNRIERSFFAIYLARTSACVVERNVIVGDPSAEATTGNAIHSWGSRDLVVRENSLSGHRDGLYLEFTSHALVVGNRTAHNQRYGLHFMYADSSEYRDNQFVRNGSGVAVMFSHHVAMIGNAFMDNQGPSSYGLLLKEIADVRLERNHFERNSTGVLADGANRLQAQGNDFVANGRGVRLLSSTADARFTGNSFRGNSFDVVVSGRRAAAAFDGNWWDGYRGWDLDRDGRGDVPHHPVRLFAMLVERAPAAMLLQRSLFVRVIDAAERTIPLLTPTTIVDMHPAMRPSSVLSR